MHFTIYTTDLTVYKPALNYDENMKNRSKGKSLKYAFVLYLHEATI